MLGVVFFQFFLIYSVNCGQSKYFKHKNFLYPIEDIDSLKPNFKKIYFISNNFCKVLGVSKLQIWPSFGLNYARLITFYS